jgi:hypothetical protein
MNSNIENRVMFKKGDIIIKSEAAYPTGALVVDGYDEQGRFMAHPLGGGLQYVFKPAVEKTFRVVSEEEQQKPLWKRSRFCIEGVDGSFEGWTCGRLWNGWEMPHFDYAVAEQVIKAMKELDGHYDSGQDAFVTKSTDGEEVWAAETLRTLGDHPVKAYPVGAGAWCWEEAA